MPELVDGKNAVLASRGPNFAAAILRLAGDPAEAERLGSAAFDQFTREMNAGAGARQIVRFITSTTAATSKTEGA